MKNDPQSLVIFVSVVVGSFTRLVDSVENNMKENNLKLEAAKKESDLKLEAAKKESDLKLEAAKKDLEVKIHKDLFDLLVHADYEALRKHLTNSHR
jgi:hypothetical protein